MKLFNKNSVGVDIADNSIEVISLVGDSQNVEILGKGRIKLDSGIVERGRIKDSKKLALALKKVLSEAKPEPIKTKEIFAVLPEAVCFTCAFNLSDKGKMEVSDIVAEAHSIIPISPETSVLSHKINSSNKSNSALVIAVENGVLAEWHQFFEKEGFEVRGFDSEPLALYRGLFSERKNNNVAIVDIGAFTTNISFFFSGFLRHSYSVNIAGEDISQSLTSSLKVSPEEAEKIKRNQGLSEAGSKESQVITKILDQISNNLEETLPYFQEKFNKKLDEVILVGGTSAMPGIDEYFEANLNLKTRVGSSFVMKKMGVDLLPYIEAIGLAIRGLNNDWAESDPILEFSGEMKVEEAVPSETLSLSTDTDVVKTKKEKTKFSTKTSILLGVLILSLAGLVFAIVLKSDKKEFNPEKVLDELIPETPTVLEDTDADIDVAEVKMSEEAEISTFVIITDTPTGWLNVREGPGVENAQITRVNPREEYKLLEESDGWYKIKIDDKVEGWISSEYAEKVTRNP